MLPDDVAVALAPARTYARLVREAPRLTWRHALERPLLVLLVIGTTGAITATGRVTISLVLSTMLLWAWAVAVQIAAGALMVASARRRSVAWPAAIDLLFAGHLPWSIWVVVVSAWHTADLPYGIVVLAGGALATIAWNAVILNAFAVVVLAASPAGARIRVAVHQTAMWACGLWFIASISGGWFRLLNP